MNASVAVGMTSVLPGLFLLVVLVDGESRAASSDCGGDLLLDLVRPCVLRVLPRLVLLVPCVCSGGDGAELGQLLHVLVMLLLLAVLLAGGLGLATAAAAAVAAHHQLAFRALNGVRPYACVRTRVPCVVHGYRRNGG